MRGLSTTLAALATVVALGACGDDSNGAAQEQDPMAQADAACVASAEGLRDVNLEQGLDITPEEGVKKVEATLPVREQTFEEIAAIEPPAEDVEDWNAFVDSYEDLVGATEDQLAALESGDEAKIAKANEATGKAADARIAAAEDLELDACASSLPDDDAKAAEAAVREYETTNDPATSCDYESPEALTTEAWVEDAIGGVKKCEAEQKAIADALPSDIKVSKTTGVDDIVANVAYENVGGRFDGEPVTATLYFVDGGWRIYSIG